MASCAAPIGTKKGCALSGEAALYNTVLQAFASGNEMIVHSPASFLPGLFQQAFFVGVCEDSALLNWPKSCAMSIKGLRSNSSTHNKPVRGFVAFQDSPRTT